MRVIRSLVVLSLLLAALPRLAAAESEAEKARLERAGTCEDAQTQVKYWCEERQKVTVVTTGLECDNAKRNVDAACKGVDTPDLEYKFEKK
jgi:hypothetical protein